MHYRADIDGLRSLAILPVLFFHAGIPGFPGGYVGVDVFFVISGFLIARIIRDALAGGSFSLDRFYERRIRRIFPALAATLLVTAVAATVLLLPDDLEAFSRSLLAAIFSVSNIYFFRTTSYFSADSTAQPLLHTWSIGVEEQFYLLLPLVMLLIWRAKPALLGPAIWLVLVASLALSIAGTRLAPGFTFFILPTRAWELLAGATIGLGLVPAVRNPSMRNVLALAGLALILAPIAFYSSTTPFPGLAAVPPVLGTCLLLHCAPGTPVARLLQVRPLVFVGLISYSLYLWHWPVLILYQYRTGASLAGWAGPALLGLSLVLAILSWRWIEQPVRRRDHIGSRTLWAGSAAALVLITVIGLSGLLADGLPQRFGTETLRLAAAKNDHSVERQRCFALPGTTPALDRNCLLDGAQEATIAVWSDSHGVELADALANALVGTPAGVQLLASSNCPPALGFTPTERPLCAADNLTISAHLRASEIDTIILAARYANSVYPDRETLLAGIEAATSQLRAAGKQVVLVGAVPDPGTNVPRRLALASQDGVAPQSLTVPEQYRQQAAEIDLTLKQIATRTGARFLVPSQLLCNPDCILYEQGYSLYFDDNHLSMAGARLLAPMLASFVIGAPDQ